MTRPLVLIVDDNKELADLLGQVMREAGYRTTVCYRGRAAREAIAAEKPAAAILDVLLPDVMGTEVSKDLVALGVPFVFVTGVFKGLQHSRNAVNLHGARAHFEKPFAAGALLAAMKEMVPPPPPAAPPRDEAIEVELDIDVDVQEFSQQSPLEMTGQVAIVGTPVKAVLQGEDLRLAVPEPGQGLVRTGPLPPVPPPQLQRGVLRDNLPQLITAFYELQETGELWLQRGKVKKAIWFEKGQPVFALSNLASDRFGTFLLRLGRIDQQQLQTATTRAAAEKRRTGEVLVAMGVLQEAERLYYVAQQVKAILYSLFAWSEGEFVMSFQARAAHEPVRLGLHPAALITRGIQKLYKKERLQRLLALEDRLVRTKTGPYLPDDAGLEPWAVALLERCDGDRTVAELLATARDRRDEAWATLVALQALCLVEKKKIA